MSYISYLKKSELINLANEVLYSYDNGKFKRVKVNDTYTTRELRKMIQECYPGIAKIEKILAARDEKFNDIKYLNNLIKVENLFKEAEAEAAVVNQTKNNLSKLLKSLNEKFEEERRTAAEINDVVQSINNNNFVEKIFNIPNDENKLVLLLSKIEPDKKLLVEITMKDGQKIYSCLNDYSISALKDLIKNFSTTNFNLNTLFNSPAEVEPINTSDSANLNSINGINLNDVASIRIFKYFNNKAEEFKTYDNVGGAFFKYSLIKYPQLKKILSKYQIFNIKEDKKEFEKSLSDNCLVYALKKSGKFSNVIINSIKTKMIGRMIPKKKLTEISNIYNIEFIIKNIKYNRKDTIKQKKQTSNIPITINLCLFEEHYFLDEYIEGITKYYIDNIDEIEEKCQNITQEDRFTINRIKNSQYICEQNRDSKLSSSYLIQKLFKKNAFEPLTVLDTMSTDTYRYVSKKIDVKTFEINKTDYSPIELIEKNKKSESNKQTIYYADCEADVSTPIHKAYSIAYVKQGTTDYKFIFGDKCIVKFMDDIENNSIVYFHNLGYDSRLFLEQGIKISKNIITKGSKVMSITMNKGHKFITLKDSYCLLSMPLAAFPSSFGLKDIKKEMFPYNYYTFENFKKLNLKGVISEAGRNEIGNKFDTKIFESNIDLIPGCRIDKRTEGPQASKIGDHFDMVKYVKFYNIQDVRILQQGFETFANILISNFNINPFETLTAPSLSNIYFNKHIYANKNIMQYNGILREYIQSAVSGGRCMTRDNQKYHLTCELNDFDAVSLYPSAMHRLYIPTGAPRKLRDEELNFEYLKLNTCGEDDNDKLIKCYIVDINITKINIPRHFPLINYKDIKTNVKRWENKCTNMRVDNITLEDLIKYQGIEFNIIGGICWEGHKDFTIRHEIEKLHNLRCQYKTTNKPLADVIKLIMNSAYGKTIQKPIEDQSIIKSVSKYNSKTKQHEPELDKYLIKNAAYIKQLIPLNTNELETSKHDTRSFRIIKSKSIDTSCSNCLVGELILSMSKRIMNEVMCLAEDLNIPLYYQDTDSMHIDNSRIKELAQKYKEIYGRELIGKNLGQFHCDFDELTNNPRSIESIFLGKKVYIDKLTNDNGDIAYHYRMKGVDLKCVDYVSNEQFNGDIITLYKYLFDHSLTFDLTKTKPRFKMDKNFTVSTINNFSRTLSF